MIARTLATTGLLALAGLTRVAVFAAVLAVLAARVAVALRGGVA